MARPPIMPEHEHGLGTSGLRRIRQQPLSRVPTLPPSPESPFHVLGSDPRRSSSMTLSLPASGVTSVALTPGTTSPTLNYGEDLSRFPSESLHSFSFAHQSEDFLHNRQNVLKRSIEYMRDRLGWAASNPGIVKAQAKISGDQEAQSMMELLARADLVGSESDKASMLGQVAGPLTGPADVDGENVFERSFIQQSESPNDLEHPSKESVPSGPDEAIRENAAIFTERCATAEPIARSEERSKNAQREGSNLGRTSPPMAPKRSNLKRTSTDTLPLTLQTRLMEALAQPYVAEDNAPRSRILDPTAASTVQNMIPSHPLPNVTGPVVHGHASRWAPAAQAIFTTETNAPWTILAANDLACLVFGVTKAEVRKLGILEVVQEERRQWLERKLKSPGSEAKSKAKAQSQRASPSTTTSLALGSGFTAQLLSKPPSRHSAAARRAQTDDGSGSSFAKKNINKDTSRHTANKSRGVLLCGDVVPIQKRNGATGSASLWVKEKKGGLIWVLEEIAEDVAYLTYDDAGQAINATGSVEAIWSQLRVKSGVDLGQLVPRIPRKADSTAGEIDLLQIAALPQLTVRNAVGMNTPATVELVPEQHMLRVSSFPHIAGIMVVSASELEIISSNSVFCAALFGQTESDGLPINDLIPNFDRILRVLTEEDNVRLVDGIVIPEHSFRRARALLALREGKEDAAAIFLQPTGLPAKHRDGSEIKVDVQMRVVKSESFHPSVGSAVIEEESEQDDGMSSGGSGFAFTEVVYALWITYSRQLHATSERSGLLSPALSRPGTPPHQPSPGQALSDVSPEEMDADEPRIEGPPISLLTQQLKEATLQPISGKPFNAVDLDTKSPKLQEPAKKKSITDFVILEEMGQGAYGQVKLARYKKNATKKMVLKYVTKRRILVDTWTRDRRLGTVPLEIHVLDYLRRDGLRHRNIVEMADFFEDDVNYYIEMVPHGLPGMDLFDYIELRVNMEEAECKSIFVQVVDALHHLHTKALVVHRDIKDENVVLDGEGHIKLIDFGSAAYIKNGPFDVFVGTIDYAAPEVLAGKSYRGKEQDVWALGILLYTIVYKENPFYSIDEIMDHDLRVPYIMSEESIDLIKAMLNRDVDQRMTITQVLEHPWCRTDKER
ncbi:MAG: hypothetical protein M1812_002616 [Candelaria pacifica]|nr:MAG: hypothetical protein M1812_002616 [Candelaria pacifica]